MTRPTYAPIITLGNIITVGTMVVTVIGFFATVKADVDNHNQWIKETAPQIKVNTQKLVSLDEWRQLGPRFTTTDADLLKARILSEAALFTNQSIAKTDAQISVLGFKLDEVNKTLVEIRLILAAANLPKP